MNLELNWQLCEHFAFFSFHKDQEGCNLISDMAIHDIDMLVWLTSSAVPKSVFVMTHIRDETLQKIGEPDAGVVALTFQDGLMATIDVFRECVYGYDIRTEVRLTQGSHRYVYVLCIRHAYDFISSFIHFYMYFEYRY